MQCQLPVISYMYDIGKNTTNLWFKQTCVYSPTCNLFFYKVLLKSDAFRQTFGYFLICTSKNRAAYEMTKMVIVWYFKKSEVHEKMETASEGTL